MRRFWIVPAILLAVLTFVSCGASHVQSKADTMHMTSMAFSSPSITIKKGESIRLVNDAEDAHIISNGSWAQHSSMQAGSPVVSQLKIRGKSQATIGPFNQAGTFYFYCTIHRGMNLLVKVT